MPYAVVFTPRAAREFKKLPRQVQDSITPTIAKLADNPRSKGCEKLTAHGGYRIRCGNFRIIYDIFDKALVVEVIKIADRKDAYR